MTPAYHVYLDEQDPQGEALPQALQPLVDVVWVEVVVAEAAGRETAGLGGPGHPQTPLSCSVECRGPGELRRTALLGSEAQRG